MEDFRTLFRHDARLPSPTQARPATLSPNATDLRFIPGWSARRQHPDLPISCAQRDQLQASIDELRAERRSKGGRVIHAGLFFRVFRAFKSDFSTRPVHEQREILRSIVARVVVHETSIRVYYYGAPREDTIMDGSNEKLEEKLLSAATKASGDYLDSDKTDGCLLAGAGRSDVRCDAPNDSASSVDFSEVGGAGAPGTLRSPVRPAERMVGVAVLPPTT